MEFKIEGLATKDSWKDIIRIPGAYRRDDKGQHIVGGTVCKLSVNGKSKYVIVRGSKRQTPTIDMDLNLRLFLKVREERSYDFHLKRVSWFGYLKFTWSASDPTYRVPAQLSLVSFVLGSALGLIGLFLGLIPILHKDHNTTPTPHSTLSSAAPALTKPNPATK